MLTDTFYFSGGLSYNNFFYSGQPYLDLDVDVTGQVASMINQNINYGFLLKLQTEATYTSRIFVASHNSTYPGKHPKLVVQYE